MTPYRPAAYQKTGGFPRTLGQTFDQILGIPPAGGDILRFLGHSIGGWFGIYIGVDRKINTLLRIIGWTMGSGMAVAALLDLVSVAKRIMGTHPPEPEQPEQPETTQQVGS